MRIKKCIAAVAVVLAASSSAFATVLTLDKAPNNTNHYDTTFVATHTTRFTDTYTFTPELGDSLVRVSLFSFGEREKDIDFTSVTLNGVKLDIFNGPVDVAITLKDVALHGLLTLIVSGNSGSDASYTGFVSVTVVPEPASRVLMLGGLGLLGMLSRRRSPARQA